MNNENVEMNENEVIESTYRIEDMDDNNPLKKQGLESIAALNAALNIVLLKFPKSKTKSLIRELSLLIDTRKIEIALSTKIPAIAFVVGVDPEGKQQSIILLPPTFPDMVRDNPEKMIGGIAYTASLAVSFFRDNITDKGKLLEVAEAAEQEYIDLATKLSEDITKQSESSQSRSSNLDFDTLYMGAKKSNVIN